MINRYQKFVDMGHRVINIKETLNYFKQNTNWVIFEVWHVYVKCVAGSWCHAQSPSQNTIIWIWVGLIRTCTIWSDIMCLRIGRASPSAISLCPFKLSLLGSNSVCVTLSESSCLPPSSIEPDLYWRCYILCARDKVPPHWSC